MVLFGLRWYILVTLVYFGIQKYTTVHNRIKRYTMVYNGIQRFTMVHNWYTIGIQLVYNWYTVGIPFLYSWYTIGIQLVYNGVQCYTLFRVCEQEEPKNIINQTH